MRYFEDSRIVSIQDLYKVVNDEGKRIYSDNLLQKIQSGDFNFLNEINLVDRNNRYFMEPILFAVKNSEFGTYEVFKYYGDELQKHDLTIATEIVINEPEVMENTVITDNPALVLHFAKINPDITLYISEDLKSNGKFIEDLCETGNKEAISNVIRECNIAEVIQDNPDLVSNPEFMREAVKEDSNSLKYADDTLKNSYEFIKEASIENKEVINYVVLNTDEFSREALEGARESLESHFISDATEEIEETRKKIKEESKATDEEVIKREKELDYVQKAIKRFRELPEEKKPRYAHLALQMCKNMDERYRTELEKYETLYLAAQEKEKKEKVKGESDSLEVTPEQIEDKTSNARISEINVVTKEIREEYISITCFVFYLFWCNF